MILVTGATGHLGSKTIDHLLKITGKDQFVALARDEQKAQVLKDKGVTVRIGDFDDIASLDKAFEGISKLFFISTTAHNRTAQQIAVVDAAKKAGIQHIVYTGVTMKDVETSALKALMESHFQTEEHIRNNGFAYTFLRNALYAEVIPMYLGEKVPETGVYFPSGDGKAAFALRQEMGEAAANVLVQEGHVNKTYHITGPAMHSFAEIADMFGALSGRNIPFVDTDSVQYKQQLRTLNIPEFYVELIAGFAEDTKNKQFEIATTDLEHLLGRKPTSLKDSLKLIYSL